MPTAIDSLKVQATRGSAAAKERQRHCIILPEAVGGISRCEWCTKTKPGNRLAAYYKQSRNPPLPPEVAQARIAAAQQSSREGERLAKLVVKFQGEGLSAAAAEAGAILKTAPRPAASVHVGAA